MGIGNSRKQQQQHPFTLQNGAKKSVWITISKQINGDADLRNE